MNAEFQVTIENFLLLNAVFEFEITCVNTEFRVLIGNFLFEYYRILMLRYGTPSLDTEFRVYTEFRV